MTGTPCANCKAGWLVVYATKRTDDRVKRFFHCWLCGHRPANNKQVIAAPHRRRRAVPESSTPVFHRRRPRLSLSKTGA